MRVNFALWAPLFLFGTTGCADVEDHDDHGHGHGHDHDGHNHGLTTTVILNFAPLDGGDILSFSWSDPENDGNPIIDDIVLPDGSDMAEHAARTYDVTVELWNDLEDPAEEVTPEILEQDDAHQFFFMGSAVEGPATGENPDAIVEHAYADFDANGLPLGSENTFTTLALGSGALRVVLRHMPPEDGNPVKVEGLAETVAQDGFGAIGGGDDVDVTFDLTVE